MNISLWGIVFGLLLLAIPLIIIHRLRLPVMQRLLLAFGRMVLAVAVMAIIVYGAVSLDSIVYDVVMLVLLSLFSAVMALGKARLNVSRLLIPAGAGSVVGVAVVVFYGLFLVLGQKNPFVARLFLPFAAIVAGGITMVNAKALQTYYTGLLHHGQLYNYIIGNGGTHGEAVRHFIRRCLQAAIVSVGRDMSRLAFVSAPAVMLAMVMCGIGVLTAAAFQVMLTFMVMAASLLSLVITLLVARRYSFDEYERLKPVVKGGEARVLKASSPLGSSASLSEPRDTDSVSQPQE